MGRWSLFFKSIGSLFSFDAVKRYEGLHHIFDVITRQFGFRIYNKHNPWQDDAAFLEMWRKFPKATKGAAERKFNLYYLAKSARCVEGHSAECGSLIGAGSHIILSGLEKKQDFKHLIFDSFEGLSEADSRDDLQIKTARGWQKHDLSASEQTVRANLAQFDNIETFAGWIPSRFSEVSDQKFCFVHVDVDLYQPTMDSLSFFYDRLNPGGILLCDDYGSSRCPGAKKAFDEFVADKPENIVYLTTGQGFIVKAA